MKPARTWILVADGSGARILEMLGRGKDVHTVLGSDAALDNPPSHEQGRDRPAELSSIAPVRTAAEIRAARVYDDSRHAVEPRYDPHRALEQIFAGQLGAMLANYAKSRPFDRLVLVATPAMLGYLRKFLEPHVRAKIIAEIDKDLTKVPNDKILSHLETVIVL